MANDRIIAEYLVETPKSLAAAAESMAGEHFLDEARAEGIVTG